MITLEVIANTVDDCIAAEMGGANRIELCAALALGGLTPTLGLLSEARKRTRLPLMYMLRPRSGGFCYSAGEFAVIQRDAELALRFGADGLVFGFLDADGAIDGVRTRAIVALAGDKATVFHRAFDVTPDATAALDTLIDIGVTRVLTSGQMPAAEQGAANIKDYIRRAAGRIQILPGGGIRVDNAPALVRVTGADQVHASLSGQMLDRSTSANPRLRFGATSLPDEQQVRFTDTSLVAQMRTVLDGC